MIRSVLNKIFIVILLLSCLGLISPGFAQRSEYEVKAAFIEKFTHFIEWPLDTADQGHFIIFVFPDSPLVPHLKTLFEHHLVKGKPVDVLISNNLMLLDSAQIVIVHHSEKHLMPVIHSIVRNKPILTIGDYPGFLEAGGILLLFREEDHIRFAINITALSETKLIVSSQLLKLAKLYQGQQ